MLRPLTAAVAALSLLAAPLPVLASEPAHSAALGELAYVVGACEWAFADREVARLKASLEGKPWLQRIYELGKADQDALNREQCLRVVKGALDKVAAKP